METKVTSIPIPHLCVVTAADIEFNAITRQLKECSFAHSEGIRICQGRAGRNQITVLQSQIGAGGFSEKLIAHLRETKYDALLVIGLAGALSPELKTGEVIFYDTCFVFRPEFDTTTEGDQTLQSDGTAVCNFQLASSLRRTLVEDGWHCVFGAGLTLDFMVTKAQEKLAMGESYGAAVVDMESYDILDICTGLSLPAIVMRVIIDEANQTTPDFNLAITTDGKMNNLKSCLAMMLRPVAAVRFLISLWKAMRALRKVAKLTLSAGQRIERSSSALVLVQKILA